MTDAIRELTAKQTREKANWSGVMAMTLCVFALVAAEFMPVSLLSPLANDLRVSEGLAGQGISVSGAFAVITSLAVATLARGLNRKHILLGMTVLMTLSSAIIGLAQDYLTYMTGRALIGIAIGGFWSMSAATAIRLVPPQRVARALAIFNSGNALATVVAAPLGSFLGAMIGWRGAFLLLIPVSLLALIWQYLALPAMRVIPASGKQPPIFGLLKRPAVAMGMAACGLFFMGQFALFTYLRPFLETVTLVSTSQLSLFLLLIGVCGFLGTLMINRVLKVGFFSTLVAIPLLMALLAVVLIGAGTHAWLVLPVLGLWGLIATAAPVGWWTWVANTLPQDAEAGGGLMVAIVQLSIALGSTAGGLAFDTNGYRASFVLSAGILLLAAILTWQLAKRAQP